VPSIAHCEIVLPLALLGFWITAKPIADKEIIEKTFLKNLFIALSSEAILSALVEAAIEWRDFNLRRLRM
jgi:hypothetical protein